MTVVDVTHMPFITLHALQAFPPSLLNRDDNHAAKQIVYGGTVRVRVSSGAGKRAIRVAMRDAAITGGQYGLRTTRFPTLTTELLVTQYGRPLPEAAAKTAMVFAELKLKANKSGNTAAPIFASPRFPAATAAAIDSDWDRIGAAVPPLQLRRLRGRHWTCTTPSISRCSDVCSPRYPASASTVLPVFPIAFRSTQRASSPTSGRQSMMPRWTVMPRRAISASPSSLPPVLYRSAFLDRRQLRTNLSAAADPEQLAVAAERSFIEWFVRAVPVAKQRSSVAATLPSLVIATCGSQVLSGAAAFTSPINGSEILKSAAASLLATLGRSDEVIENQTHVMLSTDPGLDAVINGAHHTNLRDFIDSVGVR